VVAYPIRRIGGGASLCSHLSMRSKSRCIVILLLRFSSIIFFAVGMKLPLCISQVMENWFYPEKKIIYSDNRIDILQVAFYDFLYCDTNVSKLIYGT
jgi:hypothetical protein